MLIRTSKYKKKHKAK